MQQIYTVTSSIILLIGLTVVRSRSKGLHGLEPELEPASTIKHDSQCYGTVPPNTTDLYCSTDNTLVLQNLFIGTKRKSRCLQAIRDARMSTNMTYHTVCCTYNKTEDCVLSSENLSYKQMRRKIGIAASGKLYAVVNVEQFPVPGCPEGYLENSTYNSVEYYCIPDSRTFSCDQSFARNNTKGETMYLQSPLYPNMTMTNKAYACFVQTDCGHTVTVYGVDYAFSSHMLQFKDAVSGRTLTLRNSSNDYDITPVFQSDFHKIVINFRSNGGNGLGRFRIAFKASGQNAMRLVCPYRETPEECNITITSPFTSRTEMTTFQRETTTFQSEATTFQTESSPHVYPTHSKPATSITNEYSSKSTTAIHPSRTTTESSNNSNRPITGITFTCTMWIGISLVRAFIITT